MIVVIFQREMGFWKDRLKALAVFVGGTMDGVFRTRLGVPGSNLVYLVAFGERKKHSKAIIVDPCLKRFKADRFDQKLFQLGHFVLHRRLAQVWQSLWRSF